MGFIKRLLGYGPKSRRIAQQQKAIADLQAEIQRLQTRVTVLGTSTASTKALDDEEIVRLKGELERQKKATAMMWKFIHIRHRLDMPKAAGTIRKILEGTELKK